MRKKSKSQLEAEESAARAKAHLDEIVAIIRDLPPQEHDIVSRMLVTRPTIADHDNFFMRAAQLKGLSPAERSVLIKGWAEELDQMQKAMLERQKTHGPDH